MNMPMYSVVPNILPAEKIASLQQLTNNPNPVKQWYGRSTYWIDNFEKSSSRPFTFKHAQESSCIPAVDQLSAIFLETIQKLTGKNLSSCDIQLEAFLDRNCVDLTNHNKSGLFWHRDIIFINTVETVSDYTLILLLTKPNWEGGDLLLQKGGDYKMPPGTKKNIDNMVWINTDHPQITIKPDFNQAVIFNNRESGHRVTPIKLLSNTPINRDVFIINCLIQRASPP